MDKIYQRAALVAARVNWKKEGKRVVFTNGCYDLLHPGHIRLLEQARSLGDILILALNSDDSVRRLKGPSRPLLSEQDRAEVAAALAAVDAVTVFDEDTPRELIAAVLPDVLVKGADWAHWIAGREEVEAAGGQVMALAARARLFHHRNRRRDPNPYTLIHPSIRDLFLGLGRHPAFQEALQRLRATEAGKPVALSGLTLTAKAIYSVLLWQTAGRPLLIVTDGSKEAEALHEAIDTFFDLLVGGREQAGPQLLPALDVLPFQGLSPHAEILAERALGLLRMASGRAAITVMPVGAALLRVESRKFYEQLALTLRMREEIALEDLAAHLDSIGYERREPVEMVGEYSIRGGIVDVFSPEASHPVRIELFGDEIESIRRFDVESQRSVLKLESCTLLPLTEYPNPRKEATQPGWEFIVSLDQPRPSSVFALLEKPIVVWDEPEQVRSAAERSWMRLDQNQAAQAQAEGAARIYFRWEELVAQPPPR